MPYDMDVGRDHEPVHVLYLYQNPLQKTDCSRAIFEMYLIRLPSAPLFIIRRTTYCSPHALLKKNLRVNACRL